MMRWRSPDETHLKRFPHINCLPQYCCLPPKHTSSLSRASASYGSASTATLEVSDLNRIQTFSLNEQQCFHNNSNRSGEGDGPCTLLIHLEGNNGMIQNWCCRH
uniref:Uncharacterized protein n=1 Tax=Trieres chinensis TaxID=1514140 RepID=A0A7S2AA94_TRICV